MNKLIFFVSGVAVGAAVAWKLTSKKYESLIQEEIDSVKETFAKNAEAKESPQKEEIAHTDILEKAMNKPDIMEYAAKLKDENYVNYSAVDIKTDESNLDSEKPYPISPDDFGDMYDYEKISLTYYADDILTDDADEIIDDVDEIIGPDSLEHFGEYEEDALYVRDDRKMVDYEILRDTRRYSEVVRNETPYHDEDTEE